MVDERSLPVDTINSSVHWPVGFQRGRSAYDWRTACVAQTNYNSFPDTFVPLHGDKPVAFHSGDHLAARSRAYVASVLGYKSNGAFYVRSYVIDEKKLPCHVIEYINGSYIHRRCATAGGGDLRLRLRLASKRQLVVISSAEDVPKRVTTGVQCLRF